MELTHNMVLVVFSLFGVLIQLLFALNDAYYKPDFTWTRFSYLNCIPALLNIIIASVLIYTEAYDISKFMAVVLGFAGNVVFKHLVNIVTDKPTILDLSKTKQETNDNSK